MSMPPMSGSNPSIEAKMRQYTDSFQQRDREMQKAVESYEYMFRPLKIKTYQCQIKCNLNQQLKQDSLAECEKHCTVDLMNAHNRMMQGFQQLQNKTKQCVNFCESNMKTAAMQASFGQPQQNQEELMLEGMKCISDKCPTEEYVQYLGDFKRNLGQYVESLL